jgi:hypothetical protein
MRKPSIFSVASIIFAAILMNASSGVAADTHVIGVEGFAWTYKGVKSTASTPLAVDDLKIGDVVEVQIPAGPVHHGFITIKQTGGGPPVEDKSPVLACGEDKTAKPNAVLRELDCSGAASKFGVAFTGSLRLEVMNTFKDPANFYCVIHKTAMPGVLKLAP